MDFLLDCLAKIVASAIVLYPFAACVAVWHIVSRCYFENKWSLKKSLFVVFATGPVGWFVVGPMFFYAKVIANFPRRYETIEPAQYSQDEIDEFTKDVELTEKEKESLDRVEKRLFGNDSELVRLRAENDAMKAIINDDGSLETFEEHLDILADMNLASKNINKVIAQNEHLKNIIKQFEKGN